MPDEPILRVEDLETRYYTSDGRVDAVNGVTFTLSPGEVHGLVGESGSGKSVTARSLIHLIEQPGRVTNGQVWYRSPNLAGEIRDEHPEAVDGAYIDLLEAPAELVRSLRGTAFGVIFQDPANTMNPTLTVGEQIAEAVEVHRRASANPRSTRARSQGYGLGSVLLSWLWPSQRYVTEKSRDRAVELLDQVGISDPEDRADEYPHQFSGGMLQRAAIAVALACDPDILIADEPTTGLDVTIQTQFLELLAGIQEERDMSVLLITHDLGVIARMSEEVSVMYAGEIVEQGPLEAIFEDAVHPYTQGLIESMPNIDEPREPLNSIRGTVPKAMDGNLANRCAFADRCPKAMQTCLEKPPLYEVEEGHAARCVLAKEPYNEEMALDLDGFNDSQVQS